MMGKELWPQLRFPEFKEHWKKNKLGDVARFSKGKNVSKDDVSEDGVNDCIRYGELYTTYNETISEVFSKTNLSLDESVLSQANDVIIPASGETQIDIATASCVLREGVILGGDLNIIRTANSGVFLSYYLNNKGKHDIARLSQGSSVVHLYSKQLSRLKINFPTLPEQQKIASFLATVDKKIAQLTKKKTLLEKYKKGLLEQILNQEIRFKDESGNEYPDWEEKKLGKITTLLKDGTHGTHKNSPNSKYLLLSAKNIRGGKIIIDATDRRISEQDFKTIYRNYVLQKNDILLSIVGTIGRVAIFRNEENIAFQRSVAFFRFCKHNEEFMYHMMTASSFQKELENRKVVSAQPGIYLRDLSKIAIEIPCLEEQNKIANFFSALDNKIAHVDSQIEKTSAFKKGLLQQMFV